MRRFLAGVFAILMAGQATAQTQSLVIDAGSSQGQINPHIYGHFAEHLGRGVYDGIWRKDDKGVYQIRDDVVQALKDIKIPNLRWPGGCFADYYHWKDGVGPVAERPAIVNAVWGGATEDNSVGIHEFMDLVDRLGTEPIVVGNVGSGTVRDMAEWWEYINHPGKSPMANLRRKHGREKPWEVSFWGVGNESWGCGGNMTPAYYADVYKRFATFLHGYGDVRPFRIATGPDATLYDGMFEWTEVMMREAGHMIDGLDMHYYTIVGPWNDRSRATDFTEEEWVDALRRAMRVEDHIRAVSAIMDRYDPEKRVWLIVGEWGMWHQVEAGTNPGFLHQQNSLRDALVAAVSLNIFNRHADRVQMANIAQTINVLQAMILTEPETNRLARTPTYHVFEMFKGHQDAQLVPLMIEEGTVTRGGNSIPAISASASRKDGRILITLANTDLEAARTVEAFVRGATVSRVSGRVLTADVMNAHNTFDAPDAVAPADFSGARLDQGMLTIALPPMSVVALEIK